MKYKYLIILLIALLCSLYFWKRYTMMNMMGECVDVTYEVVVKHYKPVYWHEEISKLINPHPMRLTGTDQDSIKNYIARHFRDSTQFLDTAAISALIRKNSVYDHTYFILDLPVDVFNLEFCVGTKRIFLEVRKDEEQIILPSETENSRWKVSDCTD